MPPFLRVGSRPEITEFTIAYRINARKQSDQDLWLELSARFFGKIPSFGPQHYRRRSAFAAHDGPNRVRLNGPNSNAMPSSTALRACSRYAHAHWTLASWTERTGPSWLGLTLVPTLLERADEIIE